MTFSFFWFVNTLVLSVFTKFFLHPLLKNLNFLYWCFLKNLISLFGVYDKVSFYYFDNIVTKWFLRNTSFYFLCLLLICGHFLSGFWVHIPGYFTFFHNNFVRTSLLELRGDFLRQPTKSLQEITITIVIIYILKLILIKVIYIDPFFGRDLIIQYFIT